MVLRPHRSRHRPNKTVPPGHDGSDFFYRFPFHLISRPAACLLAVFCYQATRISISPRSSPRYPRHGGRVGHGCDTADGGGSSCLPHAGVDGWRRVWAEWRRCRVCLISLVRCHSFHEMMGRRDAILEDVLSHFSPDPLLFALVGLLALNNPPPPGGGRSRRWSICGCGRWIGLLASRRAVPLSRYRSFAIAALFALRCGAAWRVIFCG